MTVSARSHDSLSSSSICPRTATPVGRVTRLEYRSQASVCRSDAADVDVVHHRSGPPAIASGMMT